MKARGGGERAKEKKGKNRDYPLNHPSSPLLPSSLPTIRHTITMPHTPSQIRKDTKEAILLDKVRFQL